MYIYFFYSKALGTLPFLLLVTSVAADPAMPTAMGVSAPTSLSTLSGLLRCTASGSPLTAGRFARATCQYPRNAPVSLITTIA